MMNLRQCLMQTYHNRGNLFFREKQNSTVLHDIDYVERCSVRHTTTFYEFRQTEKIVSGILDVASREDLVEVPNVLELGCGDGRIYTILKDRFPDMRYVGIEYDYANAERLASRALADHAVIVNDDVMHVEIPEDRFDMTIAWALLQYIKQPALILDKMVRFTRNGGLIIVAEPTLESVLLYCLVKGDLSEFIRSYKTSSRAAMWDTKKKRYNVNKAKTTIDYILHNKSLEIIHNSGISVFPSLIFGNILHNTNVDEEIRDQCESIVFDYIQQHSIFFPRTLVYACKIRK
jgi:trans-aconitate methyltransferase